MTFKRNGWSIIKIKSTEFKEIVP